jgi:hypothetical protein
MGYSSQTALNHYTWEAPMHRYLLAIVSVTALSLVSFAPASAQQFSAKLSGFNEIGGLGGGETGAILSEGQGTLTATLNASSLTYTLTFSGLTSNVTRTHIHFAKEHVAGGVFAFLCTNLAKVRQELRLRDNNRCERGRRSWTEYT